MAVPRPLLLALIGVLLMGATFTAARNARDHSASSAPNAPETATHRASPNPPTDSAARHTEPVSSGRFALRMSLVGLSDSGNAVRERDTVAARGVFQGAGATEMPKFRFEVAVRGQGESLRAGAVSLGHRAFITRGDTAYAVPRTVMSQLARARREVASYARGKTGSARPSSPSLLGFDGGRWMALRPAGTTTVDGVEATRLAGPIDVDRVFSDLGKSFGANVPGFDPARVERVARYVHGARAELLVGKADGVPRRLRMHAAIEDPGARGERAGDFRHGRVSVSFALTQVNRPQHVAPPRVVSKEPVRSAGSGAGFVGGALLGGGAVAIDQPGLAAARRAGLRLHQPLLSSGAGSTPTHGPRRVARAIAGHRTVVLFFFQPHASDDAATAAAVRAVRGRRGVSVVTDRIQNLGRYGPLIRGVGVSQAPAIVIVDRKRSARLVEGYVDAGTLAQEVADAR